MTYDHRIRILAEGSRRGSILDQHADGRLAEDMGIRFPQEFEAGTTANDGALRANQYWWHQQNKAIGQDCRNSKLLAASQSPRRMRATFLTGGTSMGKIRYG